MSAVHWLLPDWTTMFEFGTPVLEIFLRGTLVYLALFLLLRVILKRQDGQISLTDMLLIVLIADAAQNAMANEYRSITDGLLLVGTLIFWDYALDWLSYRVPRIRTLVHPEPLPLIRNGQVLKENLRKELLTEEQLQSRLREQGVADVRQVREANLEGNGHVSVIKKEEEENSKQECVRRDEDEPASEQVRQNMLDAGGEDARTDADEIAQFLDVVQKLEGKVRWHQQQINGHKTSMAAIRGMLARHGIRLRTFAPKPRADAPLK